MSSGLVGYDPQRVEVLRGVVVAACDHLARAPMVDDPLAADALATVRLVRSHLEDGWLPVLGRIAASRAMLEFGAADLPAAPLAGFGFGFGWLAAPLEGPPRELPVSWGPSNAVARAAAEAAVAAGEAGRFGGRTRTYEVIETTPSTSIPATGHDPDGGSGFYDILVEDHWLFEHNLADPPPPAGMTPAGPWAGWVLRLARLVQQAQQRSDGAAHDRGLAWEQLAVEARGRGGKGGVGRNKNVAVGRLTTTEGDDVAIGYRAVSGDAVRPGFVGNPVDRQFRTDKDREFDTEVKIMEDVAARIEPDADGVVEIFTELPPCDSCRKVMAQFHRRFPNVQVRVYYRMRVEIS